MQGPGPEVFSIDGWLDLVALDPEDGTQSTVLSVLSPKVYSLINGCGWVHICVGEDEMFAE